MAPEEPVRALPNTRMQRTRSSASPPRSPLMRNPLGGHKVHYGAVTRCWALTIGLLLVICASLGAQEPSDPETPEGSSYYCDPLMIGGTFSNLHFDERLQKAEGMEVRIVSGECGYQASVQFGVGQGPESNWSRLTVVDIVFTSDLWPLHVPWPSLVPQEDAEDFWFSIAPGTVGAGEFYGVIYRDRLDGLFRPAGGVDIRLSLPRVGDGKAS